MKEKTPQTSCQQPNRGISVITPLPFWGGEGGGATELLKTYSRQSTQSVTAVVDNIIELGNIFTK